MANVVESSEMSRKRKKDDRQGDPEVSRARFTATEAAEAHDDGDLEADDSMLFARLDHLDRSNNLTVYWLQWTGNEAFLKAFAAWGNEHGETDYGTFKIDVRGTRTEIDLVARLTDELPGDYNLGHVMCTGDFANGKGNAEWLELITWTGNVQDFIHSRKQ